MAATRRRSSLTFIASDVAPSLAAGVAGGDSRWPILSRFAGRGRVGVVHVNTADTLAPAERSVLQGFGLDAVADRYPSAAVSYIGEQQKPSTDGWIHIRCVHFAAGLNDLTAVPLDDEARLSAEEQLSIAATLDAHVRLDGYELVTSPTGRWLLRCPRPLSVHTIPPELIFGRSLDRLLPTGTDGAELRRLMTEIQMLLHEHPVNILRSRRSVPAANAVWLWGAGVATPMTNERRALATAFGNHPYLKGICFLHAHPIQGIAPTIEALQRTDVASNIVAIVEGGLDELESAWMPTLASALQRGVIGITKIHLDRWRIEVRRSDLRRFWRASLPPSQWAK